jgi:hypothetical protein
MLRMFNFSPLDLKDGIYTHLLFQQQRIDPSTGSYAAEHPRLYTQIALVLDGWPDGAVTYTGTLAPDLPGWGGGDTLTVTLGGLNGTHEGWLWLGPDPTAWPTALPKGNPAPFATNSWALQVGTLAYTARYGSGDPTADFSDGQIWCVVAPDLYTPQLVHPILPLAPPSPVYPGALGLWLTAYCAMSTATDPGDPTFGCFTQAFSLFQHSAAFAFEKTPRAYTCVHGAVPTGCAWSGAASWAAGGTVKLLLKK